MQCSFAIEDLVVLPEATPAARRHRTVKPFTASGPEPRVNGSTGAFQPRIELAFTGRFP